MARSTPREEQVPLDFGPTRPRVRPARDADRGAIRDAIARAFLDDPVATHLFPDERLRRRRFGRFAEITIDSFGGHGVVLTDDPVRGASIWQAPAPPAAGFWLQLRLLLRVAALTRSAFPRAARLAERLREQHFEEPHWYLAVVGTVPESRGLGLGAALIQPILARCDAAALPAYLESSKESNIPFYERFGFEVVREVRIPDGPTLWPMLRHPRAAAGDGSPSPDHAFARR